MTHRWAILTALVLIAASALTVCSTSPGPIRVGAIYPLSGPQAEGGRDEYRGALLATQLVNQDGGVDGRQIQLVSVDTPAAEAAPEAVDLLQGRGVDLVVGSYGSTISAPAAVEAARRGMLFWETGAVGMLPPGSGAGATTFRFPPTGMVLGRAAISFVAKQLAPAMGRDPSSLRFGVAYVNDIYGRSVADGAIGEIRALGMRQVGPFPYTLSSDWSTVARRIARARTDVLFVSAYLTDGIALRRALVREHVPLVAAIGTSSSYCMPVFGKRLGTRAVGLFASDKPTGAAIDPTGLTLAAAALLQRARDAFRARWGEDMDAPSLAGFSATWALLHDVLPRADDPTPSAVAAAALSTTMPMGSLPNGSGIRFAPAGSPDAGANQAAANVIWEWVRPGHAEIVWPPSLATHPITPMDIVR
jgi:branched-chain amino acid transport system substrate-binding protein